jgi:CO/xanthine dehydrogenase Mo-binding subunit
VNLGGASHGAGIYRVPNAHIEVIRVYTNTIPGGQMRAPGEPQGIFAGESHIDCVARGIGMDPLEFRRKNLIGEGEETLTGSRYQEVRVQETLEAAVEAAGYGEEKPAYVGRGIAVGNRGPGGGETVSAVTLNPDGSVLLSTPVFDQGTGTYTTLQQVVAEELVLPPERIGVTVWDTDLVTFDSGIGGSRGTRTASNAAFQAAQEVKSLLRHLAAELLDWPESQVTQEGDEIVRQDTGERQRWDRLLTQVGHAITGQATVQDTGPSPVTGFTAQVAEVSVDPETGAVTLRRFTTAHDVGRIINPVGHQGQINGGVLQGIGYALMEELSVEEGRVTSTHFGDYKIPTIRDLPELRTVLVESDSGVGPYKIKGIGENPNVPVAAAIANAVEDAVGVRIRDLPITAEKVLAALKASKPGRESQ